MEKTAYTTETVIRPGKGVLHLRPRELWEYRELFTALSLRNLKIRYKQTAAGVVWAVLKPLLTVAVLTVVAKFVNSDSNYLMIYAAVLPWTYFGNTLTQNTLSLVTNSPILTKVYFPRILLPASSYAAAFVDFLVAFVLFAGLLAFEGIYPNIRWLLLPVLMLFCTAFSLGLGLIFSVFNVRFRDVQFIVPFLLQLGMFICPVMYTTSGRVPEHLRPLYSINPITPVIDGFRWCVFENAPLPNAVGAGVSILIVAIVLFAGLGLFRRMERTFADEI